MAKIPRTVIKGLVKRYFDASITDNGADELARILEGEAARISKYAVENAKKGNRGKVTGSDIRAYVIKGGSDDA